MSLPAARRLSALVGAKNPREALVTGAQIYINFLSLTRRSGWLQAHISKQTEHPSKAREAREALERAAQRHIAFMELRKDVPAAVPTRDISVVWSADLLRPTVGAIKDHMEEEAFPATAWFNHQHHRLLQSGALFQKATGRRWSIANTLEVAGLSLIHI